MYLVTYVLQPRMDPSTQSSGTQTVQSSVSYMAVSFTASSIQGAYIDTTMCREHIMTQLIV